MTTAPQAPKTATIHPGSVIHCWDHLVITLRDDGAEKVRQGITTAEEVSRVTQEDSMSLEAFG
jgi:hypothetical protein